MFSVASNNVITITRGDSASTSIFINCGDALDTEQYVLEDTDAVYVGVMENDSKFEDAIIKYKLTSDDLDENNNVVWSLKPTDTEYLEPGKYFYEVKLTRNDGGLVDTVVSKTPFFIQD